MTMFKIKCSMCKSEAQTNVKVNIIKLIRHKKQLKHSLDEPCLERKDD